MKKVLIVEDDKSIREEITTLFLTENWQVTAADNNSDALQAVRDDVPDIIIYDFNITGFDLFEILIQSPVIKKIPFIFLATVFNKNCKKVLSFFEKESFARPYGPDLLLEYTREKLQEKSFPQDAFALFH
jgi:DNA-binding response OmpR family regulator